MEKPFSYPIYQQAKRLYQQSKINSFRVTNNIVDAVVIDGNAYQVKLVFNATGQLTSKKCDCPYAKFYHECKHMAAVYMKAKDDNALKQGPIKLKELYDVYIGDKVRPLEKNYSDFEYKLKQTLNKFRLNKDLETIFSYCLEFSNLIYPNHRKELIIMYIQDILNDLRKEFSNEIDSWMKQCLIDDKNEYLHDYFIRVFQTSNPLIFEELIQNEKVQYNIDLLNKLTIIVYENSKLTIDEFLNEYLFLNNEACLYLSAKNLLDKKEFSKVIKAYYEFINKYPYSSLKKEMNQLHEKALLGNDPEKYVDKYIEKLNYWTRDFDELSKIKKIIGDDWEWMRVNVYEKISNKVQASIFRKLLIDQDEWEVAIFLIYQNPSYENVHAYLDMIMKHDEYAGYALYFEYVIDLAKHKFIYNYDELVVDELIEFDRKYKNQEVLDQMVYYLRKLFEDNDKLIEALDKMEEVHAY